MPSDKTSIIKHHVVSWTDTKVPSASGFCQKLESYFRATDIPYENEAAYPSAGPKGNIPFVTMPSGEKIPDSHFIIRPLKASGISKDLDTDLTPAQKGDSRAWQSWLEEVVYPCMVYERWAYDAGYAITVIDFKDLALWPINALLPWYFRRRTTNVGYYAGVGRHSIDEVHILEEFVDALGASLADVRERDYFHQTSSPAEIDIFLYGFLIQALGMKSNPYFSKLVLEKESLKTFTRRLLDQLHPEYERIKELLE